MTDLDVTLEQIASFIRRFVWLTEIQADALALWVAHTHATSAAACTPYIGITSAEKRSGKTRLLEVLELLVWSPLPTANISDAALFRAIAELNPTLLFDEIDAIFGPKARDREDLRGMLNAGYREGAVARRMGGPRMTTLEAFPVYCAKAFAGIGELPDTLADRSIRIRLERRTRDEPLERFRRRDVVEFAEPIRMSIESLMTYLADALTSARPHLPDELDDRQQDCWEPLLAVADLAEGSWSGRARHAAITLSDPDAREDESLSAKLLSDIHQVFSENDAERYRTADLIAELSKIEESPWGDWYGKTITPQALSKFLRPFQIKTMPVWADGQTVKGYKAEQFANAWYRVLGVRWVRRVRSGSSIEAAPNQPNPPNPEHVNGHRPLIGEPGYVLMVDAAYAAGHLTDAELREQICLDALVRRAQPAEVIQETRR
jgi:hypothetical protein